jgi:hypothetical protein
MCVAEEHLYWVASLGVPSHEKPNPQVLQCGGVQLFLSRARTLDARFSGISRCWR